MKTPWGPPFRLAARLCVVCFPVAVSLLGAMNWEAYRDAVETGDPTLEQTLARWQWRITNRETAYIVARHRAVLEGDPKGGEGLIPEGGRSPWEENLVAWIRQMAGSQDEALFHYQRAFSISQYREVAPFLNRALLLLEQGNWVEAHRWVLENEKYFPDHPDVALVKSVSLACMEDPVGADRALTRTAVFGPLPPGERAVYFKFRGLFLEGRGSNELALVTWRQAASLDPADPLSRAKVKLLAEKLSPPAPSWIDAVDPKARGGAEEGRETGGDAFLTDRQLRNQLASVARLVTNGDSLIDPARQALRDAWERLDELSGRNSALYGREIWYWRAKIAMDMGRAPLASRCLERARAHAGEARGKEVRIERLASLIEAAILAGDREREERARLAMDLEPRRQAVRLLAGMYPPARRVPVPPAIANLFFLDTGLTTNSAPVPEEGKVPFAPTLRRHLRGGETLDVEQWSWDEQGRPLRVQWRDASGKLILVKLYEYGEVGRCWRVDALGQTNGLTETRRGMTNGIPWMEQLDFQEGRLVSVMQVRGRATSLRLPDAALLRETESRQEGRTRIDLVSAAGIPLWEETTWFEDERMEEGSETRRERRAIDGNLVETRRWEKRGGQAWKEWRLAPDGRVLEWWQWE